MGITYPSCSRVLNFFKKKNNRQDSHCIKILRLAPEVDNRDHLAQPLVANGNNNTVSNSLGVHGSIFAPLPSLHPYHELPLAWQQSTKLLPVADNITPVDIEKWDKSRVVEFVTSLTDDKCAAKFEQQVRILKFFC